MATITPREALSRFCDEKRDSFNPIFFKRDEDEIVSELMNVIRSCERHNEYFTIQVDSFRVVDNYDEINRILFEYYDSLTKNKSKNKKRDNQYEFINLNDSDIRLLIVRYYIKDRTEDDYLDVIIAIPRIVDKYYFRINGIMRSTLFQIVDGSTYNNGTSNAKVPSITLKIIFMATRITRYYNPMITTNRKELKVTYYHSRIFSKGISAAKYIFAKYGFYGALRFMGLDNGCVYITREDPCDINTYTFKASNGIYINSPKEIFDNTPMLQSVVLTIYQNILAIMPEEMIFDDLYWVRSLGSEFSGGIDKLVEFIESDCKDESVDTLDKGYSILDSFENIYDISTKESIRLPESEKATTYHIIRWIMREFNALRLKDNLDISCKRIRFAEYISSLYAFKIAKGIYRVSDMNKKATIISIRKAIRTDPNFLLLAITKSKMVSYRNMVSDMDSMQALKFTYKGVSGLGEDGGNNAIPDIYRSIHPSHIGKLDLDSSSDGNPGMTGTISPYAPIYDGGFFEEYEEPNTWESEFLETIEKYNKAMNLKDALIFEEKVLGKDNGEQISVTSEVIASMQQIIKPVIYADQGPIIPLEDIYNGC